MRASCPGSVLEVFPTGNGPNDLSVGVVGELKAEVAVHLGLVFWVGPA
jgi:hypothetical protein